MQFSLNLAPSGNKGAGGNSNGDRNWWDEDVIGIELGITLLMIENERTGLVWRTWQHNEAIGQALEKAGFEVLE